MTCIPDEKGKRRAFFFPLFLSLFPSFGLFKRKLQRKKERSGNLLKLGRVLFVCVLQASSILVRSEMSGQVEGRNRGKTKNEKEISFQVVNQERRRRRKKFSQAVGDAAIKKKGVVMTL